MFIEIKDIKPGDVLTLDGFVMASPYGSITWHSSEITGYITIAPAKISVVVPEDFNVTSEAIKAVDAQIEQVKKEHHEKLQPYLARRDQLLQISYAGQEILDPEKPE